MPRAAEPRRAVPMKLQRDLALAFCADLMRRLGLAAPDAKVEFDLDHDPALGLRAVDPGTGRHVPHQHDPAFLLWRPRVEHKRKTIGNGATTAGSDVGEMRKTRQLVEKRVERGEVSPDDPSIAPWAPTPGKAPKHKREWRSRPFQRPKKRQARATGAIEKFQGTIMERGR